MATTADYWVSGATIGSGAFGVVVHARHKTTGLDVAIKCLDKHSLAKYPHQALLVVQEQQLLKRLKQKQRSGCCCGPESTTTNNNNNNNGNGNSCNGTNVANVVGCCSNTSCPFVVNLYASFHDAMCVYLVTECCTGGTLQDYLEFQSNLARNDGNGSTNGDAAAKSSQPRNAAATATSSSWYGWQLVQALWYLHTNAKIVHCDVKPANILLTAAGCVKLADFGAAYDLLTTTTTAAKPVVVVGGSVTTAAAAAAAVVLPTELSSSSSTTTAATTQSHFVQRGTAAYSAPELIHGSIDVVAPAAADLWSLGCVLYALLQCPVVVATVASSSPFDCQGNEAATIQAVAAYCLQSNASARCAMLVGTHHATTADDDDDGTLAAWTALIGGLLHPVATERLGARDALQRSPPPPSPQLLLPTEKVYPSIQASPAWQARHLQETPETFRQRERASARTTGSSVCVSQPPDEEDQLTIPLPPVPSWWTHATSLNTASYKDGQEGWSAFLV
jgi:serine/threonine protein kinase